jgi:hypothetical protein
LRLDGGRRGEGGGKRGGDGDAGRGHWLLHG